LSRSHRGTAQSPRDGSRPGRCPGGSVALAGPPRISQWGPLAPGGRPMSLNLSRRAALPWVALLIGLVSIFGCGTRTAEKEEHEEALKTGSHGGQLVELSPEAVQA